MCRAYEILNYPNPYHFSSIFSNAKDSDMWMEAFRAKFDGIGTFGKEQWDALLGHCGAVTDQPAILFAAVGEWDTGGIWPNFGPAHDEHTARRAYGEETLQRLVDTVRRYDPDGVLQIGGFTRMLEDPAVAA